MNRVRAFDWLRGLAIPLMIQCHSLSLLWLPLKHSRPYAVLVWLDGLVAPAFLLTAGFALGLLEMRSRAKGVYRSQRAQTLWRIGRVLVAATLVNWMWFPLFQEPHWIFRVDILHCIAFSLLTAFPIVTLLSGRPRLLQAIAWAVGVVLFVIAPLGQRVHGPFAMLVNTSTGAVFPLLPWTGYVFIGAALGVQRVTQGLTPLLRRLGWIALFAGVVWLLGPLYENLYPAHDVRVAQLNEHARRLTLLSLTLWAFLTAEAKQLAFTRGPIARVLENFGRASLVAYIFHEAALYWGELPWNLFALLGHQARWPTWWGVTAGLIVVTYGVGRLSERIPSFRLKTGTPAPRVIFEVASEQA